MTLFVMTLGVAASGCATGGTEAGHGLGAGQWQARLPATQSPIAGLAFGRGGSSERADLAALDSDTPDDVLRPTVTEVTMASKSVAKPAQRRVPSVAAFQPAPAAAVAQAETQPQQVEAPVVTEPSQPLLAANDVDSRYAQREAQAQDQQKFRGGDAIVISAGAIVVVLLIVILVLLLR
jgi:cobalamin biosynthesis Mg chelatase CobN